MVRYTVVDGVLDCRGYSAPLLRCISSEQARQVLVEIHMGICSDHAGERILVGKAMQVGYYWPHALKNAEKYVQKCRKCQEHAGIINRPSGELVPITSP